MFYKDLKKKVDSSTIGSIGLGENTGILNFKPHG